MSAGVTRARTLVVALAFWLTVCIGAAMGFAVLASEQGKITETQRAVAIELLEAIERSLPEGAGRPSGAALAQQAVAIGATLSADLHWGWSVRVQDAGGQVLAAAPGDGILASKAIVVRARLADAASTGLELLVSVRDDTETALQQVLLNLAAGLVIALCAGLELLRWMFARGVGRPMGLIIATAMAGVGGDYRRSPGLGDGSELGLLQTALARFLSYVTLRRQEVTLMLQDARRDTYDPDLVARAGGWLERLAALARFAPDELAAMPMQGDAGLQRLLCFLAALLLGLHAEHLIMPMVLGQTLASVLIAGRLGSVLPRWLGRRGTILAGTAIVIAALAMGLHASPDGSLMAGSALLALVLRAATAGDAEPEGEAGLQLDAGGFSGIAAGLAVAATILLLVPESVATDHDDLWPWGLGLFGLVAVAALQERLAPPARSVLPRLSDLAGVLLNLRLCAVVVLLVMPAAACAGLLLRTVLAAPAQEVALLAGSAGVWLAAVIARGAHRVPGLVFLSRAGAGALLLGVVGVPQALEPWHVALAGIVVGVLWHGAALALYETARAQSGLVAGQASLRAAYALRALAIVVAVVAVSPAVTIGAALLAGAVVASIFGWLSRRSRARPVAAPATAPGG